MNKTQWGRLIPFPSVFASFIGALLVAGAFVYNNYRFSQYKFIDFSSLVFYEKLQIFTPNYEKFLLVVFSSNQSNWKEIIKTRDKNLKIFAVDLMQKRLENEPNLYFITSDINTILNLMNNLGITTLPSSVEMKRQKNQIYKQDSRVNKI